MLLKLLILLLFITKGKSLQCIPLGVCECALEDGSGTVSLKGIPQNSDGSPVFFIDAGFYSYSYNPCKGFRGGQFENLAILQAADDGAYYDLGVQQNEYFNYTDGTGLYVHYQSASKQRTSRVQLVCNRDIENHLFYFIGELIIKEYDFVLEGPCACPGGCDENGVIVPVEQAPVSALKWNVVGYDLVSLILHDLLLIGFIIVAVLLMMYLCGLNVTCVE